MTESKKEALEDDWKGEGMDWSIHREQCFILEYLIQEVKYGKNLKHVANPALAVRFLDFPTQIIYSRSIDPSQLVFFSGKKCKFFTNFAILRDSLQELPLYIMLVDANPQE